MRPHEKLNMRNDESLMILKGGDTQKIKKSIL